MTETDRRAAMARWMEETVSLVQALRELLDERNRLLEENRDLARRLAETAEGLAAVERALGELHLLAGRMRDHPAAGVKGTFFRRPSGP